MKNQYIILKKGHSCADFSFFEGSLEDAIYQAKDECEGTYNTITIVPYKPIYQVVETQVETTIDFIKP